MRTCHHKNETRNCLGRGVLFACLLVLLLSLIAYAEENSDQVGSSVQSTNSAGTGDQIAPQKQPDGKDKPAAQKPDDKTESQVKKPARIPLPESEARVPNGQGINRTSQEMNQTMRSLNNTIRDMNTQINRIRNLDRRLQSLPRH